MGVVCFVLIVSIMDCFICFVGVGFRCGWIALLVVVVGFTWFMVCFETGWFC